MKKKNDKMFTRRGALGEVFMGVSDAAVRRTVRRWNAFVAGTQDAGGWAGIDTMRRRFLSTSERFVVERPPKAYSSWAVCLVEKDKAIRAAAAANESCKGGAK